MLGFRVAEVWTSLRGPRVCGCACVCGCMCGCGCSHRRVQTCDMCVHSMYIYLCMCVNVYVYEPADLHVRMCILRTHTNNSLDRKISK